MTLWNCVLYLGIVLYVGLRMRAHFWCEYFGTCARSDLGRVFTRNITTEPVS